MLDMMLRTGRNPHEVKKQVHANISRRSMYDMLRIVLQEYEKAEEFVRGMPRGLDIDEFGQRVHRNIAIALFHLPGEKGEIVRRKILKNVSGSSHYTFLRFGNTFLTHIKISKPECVPPHAIYRTMLNDAEAPSAEDEDEFNRPLETDVYVMLTYGHDLRGGIPSKPSFVQLVVMNLEGTEYIYTLDLVKEFGSQVIPSVEQPQPAVAVADGVASDEEFGDLDTKRSRDDTDQEEKKIS